MSIARHNKKVYRVRVLSDHALWIPKASQGPAVWETSAPF